MTDFQDDVEKGILTTMMEVVELSEKFQKMGAKDVPSMATSALVSNRKHPFLKKLLDLESKIVSLRTSITKGSIQMALQKDTTETSEKKEENKLVPETPIVEEIKEQKKQVKEELVSDGAKEKPKKQAKEDPDTDGTKEKPKKPAKKKEAAEPVVDSEPKQVVETPQPVVETPQEEPKAEKKPKAKKTEEVKKEEPVANAVHAAQTVQTAQPGADSEPNEPIHTRRKKIPKQIKTLVWNEYIGAEFPQGRCYCCKKEKIDQRNYHCGHVIAESKGGDLNMKNLRPICAACNASMGTQSMNEFTKTFFGWEI
jgi:hypothetical protein